MADQFNSDSSFLFFTLPSELIYKIVSFLYGVELAKLRLVSYQFNDFILGQDQLAWKKTIYSELTTNPELLSHEHYQDFYKRAYLGIYRHVTDCLTKHDQQTWGFTSQYDGYATVSHYIEKNYSYGQYLKEEEEIRQDASIADMNDYDRRHRLCSYLGLAAKHGFEIWAKKLCQQAVKASGIHSTHSVATQNCEYYFICPLFLAILENNDSMIKELIELGIRYHSPNPRYIKQSDDGTLGEYSCRLLHDSGGQIITTHIICKVVTCLRHDPHLLKVFLNSLALPPIHQAAIYKNIDEFKRYVESGGHINLNISDNYYMTPLMYCILLSREDIIDYIYSFKSSIIVGHRLADPIRNVLNSVEYKAVKVIREQDRECYHFIVSEIFKDEEIFTINSQNDALPLILADLIDKDVFHAACRGAICSRNSRAIYLLTSDLPILVQFHMSSIACSQHLLTQITCTRNEVIASHGIELLHKAIRYGKDSCIRQLIQEGVELSVIGDNLWYALENILSAFIALPRPSIFASNIEYREFHQFQVQLCNQDFDPNAIAETLLPYKLAKAIADLPKFLTPNITVGDFITEIMLHTMYSDWKRPIFNDHKLQNRLTEISCALLEKLLALNKNHNEINARTRMSSFKQGTLLHAAARLGNPAWVQLLLQAGADRQIEDLALRKPVYYTKKFSRGRQLLKTEGQIKNLLADIPVYHVVKWTWECASLLENYQSCSLPSK
ncbi:hypothetical protein TrispH2_005602 [Trichoplax sp. H2]|nr:hypothetical protein TrispH2_005602 [Trichoplax sp. H2]|eukprot:RDD42524.1 hypothetical protein TrispH2_005602 [Trichoplax sp. H2]